MSVGLPADPIEGVFAARHRFLLVLMWAQVPTVAIVGLVLGQPVYEVGLASLAMVVFALAALVFSNTRFVALTVAVGLMTSSFVLIDYLGQLPFSHVYFFFMVTAISIYRDRLVLATGVMAVAMYHLIAAVGRPEDPLVWAATHSGAVALFALLLTAGWQLASNAPSRVDSAGVRFRMSFETAPIGMAFLSPSGKFLETNRAMEDFLGHDRESLVGSSISSLVHPDDRDELGEAWAKMGNSAEHQATEWMRWRGAGGRPVWSRVSIALVPRTRDSAAMVIVQVEDTGHAHEEQRRLEQALERKDEFVATVGEEIQRPLRLLIDLTSNPDVETAEAFPRIGAQATKVAAVVDDLVVSARADTAPVSVVPGRVNAESLCREVVGGMPGAMDVSFDFSPTQMWADPALTRHIVYNLVSNALDYGGTSVVVRTRRSGPDTVIQVIDDGPEVPASESNRLFGGDLRSGQPVTRPAAVGLGLAVGRHLARQMEGDIEYRRSPDGENIFELRLPSEEFNEVPRRIPA